MMDNNRKGLNGSETDRLLQEIIDTLHNSDIFPQVGKDTESRFWATYEKIAKQHDAEFLERHTNHLDACLIFAGLFSAISTAFIVNMQADLSLQPTETTNALLKILIHTMDGNIFPNETLSPIGQWSGPSYTDVWIQSFAYASLSTSLLAAFGAVLGKQWLGHFKASSFGAGALSERCLRRQEKLQGLHQWHFDIILDGLSSLLQLSLFFFGISLSADLWTLQNTLGMVVTITMAIGALFYIITFFIGVIYPHSPFRNGLSSSFLTKLITTGASFYSVYRSILSSFEGITSAQVTRWKNRSKEKDMESTRTNTVPRVDIISDSGSSTAVDHIQEGDFTNSMVDGSKTVTSSAQAVLRSSNATDAAAVQWLLETSTEPETTIIGANMATLVEWSIHLDLTPTYWRLHDIFRSCLTSQFRLSSSAKNMGVSCLKAMFHLYSEGSNTRIETEMPSTWRNGDADHVLRSSYALVEQHLPQELLVAFSMSGYPVDIDFKMELFSEKEIKWLTHVLPYATKYHIKTGGKLYGFDICLHLIVTCLSNPQSQPPVISNCFLSMALFLELNVDSVHFLEVDKSTSIPYLRSAVLHRIKSALSVISAERNPRLILYALELLHPLSCYLEVLSPSEKFLRQEILPLISWSLHTCFRILKGILPTENGVTLGSSMEALHNYARSALHISAVAVTRYESIPNDGIVAWKGRMFRERIAVSSQEFGLFVDYISELQHDDHTGIEDVLLALSNMDFTNVEFTCPAREPYLDFLILSMASEMPISVRHTALKAAWAFRKHLFTVDDISTQTRFADALVAAVQGEDLGELGLSHTNRSTRYAQRDFCYFGIICLLSSAHSWQTLLTPHFIRCLRIMERIMDGLWKLTPLHKSDNIGPYVVYALQLFPSILTRDAQTVETTDSIQSAANWIWQLIWRAWASFVNEDTIWFDSNIRDRSEGERSVMYLSAYTTSCLQTRSIKHRELRELKAEVYSTLLALGRWNVKQHVILRVQELKDRLDWHHTTVINSLPGGNSRA